ncbi:PaaX family transcriptional regulator C-terminal domain-containing protein [Massilia sp. R2A-15]|uniref:PaaX family transcriptional regulator n=1 Tax=Massilia sp. R2A-15 TaxID=3064278 RepID=UPI0027359643|nr:PaaX family transcriptional regulator C-terminal domain-containing protein [Massilia sp. R2A-15]WLI90544.1 PaaX family transcriptional regulator C-terminal domain-containing protein [Massilia sp. R2A-15]
MYANAIPGSTRRSIAPPHRTADAPCLVDGAIAARLAGNRPAAGDLVAQVVEDAAPAGGVLWLSSLAALMAPFGVGERLMRTCVFRLVRQGVLCTVRDGRRSACWPSAARRAAGAPTADEPVKWTIVVGWLARLCGAEQEALRKHLWNDGFRLIAPGVFALPGAPPATLSAGLERLGIAGRLWVCQMNELPDSGQRPLSELVDAAWDLAPVVAGYRDFIAHYAPLLDSVRAAPALTDCDAFVLRTLVRCDWRRAQRHDPRLPAALLPPDWPAERGAQLRRELEALTADGAGRHLARPAPPSP